MSRLVTVRSRSCRLLLLLALLTWLGLAACLPRMARAQPTQGPGGPILVITSPAATFGTYYAEILRAEGLNQFSVADASAIDAATLAAYDVVVLASITPTDAQATTLADWVNAGGNLIAMAPDARLAGLLGITPAGGSVVNGYVLVDTAAAPGAGIVAQTMQFHGSAQRYTLAGATPVAMLYGSAATATPHPAVTLHSVGTGHAAAFAYDLATSIVQTRQGNPAWATQERDGLAPIRSDDKFFGNAAADPQPDWIDLDKVAIPQADEQQRLFANLLLHMNQSRKPLPRFWYFPKGKKAVIVMTGDDHGNNGTAGRFEQFRARSTPGCSVADWECVRGTSYIYPSTIVAATPLTDAQAAAFAADGFEVGLHVTTDCDNYTPASLDANYAAQTAQFRANYPSLPALVTQRHHCIAWSDWATGALVQFNYGMRLDTTYYYWPPGWVANTPGLFTGSAMPMRFAGLDGGLIDVYQAATQMTDESGQSYPFTVDTLLDRALGPEGYYGAYVVNAHTDIAQIPESDRVVASALARGVPIVSSAQMLAWLDGRNGSSFNSHAWNGSALAFNIARGANTNGLQAMLPVRSAAGTLAAITRGGSAIGFTISAIKGVDYAFFTADAGSYLATYSGGDAGAPAVVANTPSAGATNVALDTAVTATFNEAMSPASINGSTFELRSAANAVVAATVSYDAATRVATLRPSFALGGSGTYTATLRGGASEPRVKDLAGNALAASLSWSFTTVAAGGGGNCPCTGWSPSAVPANPSVADPNPIELGVKFRSDTGGFISGVRFYKGAGNTGTHVGNLWTSGGQLLASATFTGETATGWQQVNFDTPVAITANTVYVASYFAPNGGYAGDNGFFTASSVDNPPIHLLQDGVSGGNGVYTYGPASAFPASSFQATNYWVDVVFTLTGPSDGTPPTVGSTSPASGATGVAVGAPVTASFSEPLDPLSVGTATFELRDAGNDLVAATVSYSGGGTQATLSPTAPLAGSQTYTATLRGGGAGPRIRDVAGNPLSADVSWTFTTGLAGGICAAPPNAVVAENCLPGNPASEWDVSGAGDPSIQGYATQISVNRGETVSFKVDTDASNYRFDIYRMGYYGGLGARRVATVSPSAGLPQTQPNCLNDTTTGLIDCGNWGVSGAWAVPANAVSGIYFAKLVRADTAGASHVFFVVRDDAGTSEMLFQTSDTTWQAYNSWGGNSLYTGAPAGRAYKVSYNRPFNTRAVDGGQDWVFNAEYPAVRWLEANGYDVSYFSGVDTDRSGPLLRNHEVFLSVGHDEYWSGPQRANVEAARDAGVNLAFLSGNEIFWKTRWENSIDGSATPYRTLVSYKETHANAKIDPSATWTGTWRDPRFSPPADGGRPENALTGTMFTVNTGTTAITVPEAEGKLRLWRNTSIANLAPGTSATLPNGTLGYEWDSDLDNGFRPAGLMRLSNTLASGLSILVDQGSTYATGSANHALTLYKHASGARVFGAGTIQWTWGLDAVHDRAGTPADARMQQAMVNLFADMGVQPATLRPGLVPATASTDAAAPTSAITSPQANASVQQGIATTISGTASDAGGGQVGGVEVSTDNGATWHPAVGRSTWTYSWTPAAAGPATLRTRAVDDSGNIESPAAGVAVSVQPRTCPCTIWLPTTTPATASTGDTGAVNVGVKFTSDQSGFITGIRFYKGAANTGTHVGTLWSSSGQQLATATFVEETATGWQQVNFAQPVAVTAGTVYVASYFAPDGGYAGDNGYFATTGVDSPPLRALRDGASGANGVYAYGGAPAFPTSGFQSSNYWVDVVFETASANRPPVLTQPAAQTSTQGSPATLVLSASDPDGDTLGFAATGLPTGLAINAASGVISGTPTAAGSFNPAVTVQDGRGGSANASFAWTIQAPANQVPVLTTPAAQTSTRDTAVSLAVAASDPDGDPLTFSATGLPTGLSISPSSGLVSGTPTVSGTFNPTLTVQDGRGGSATGSFSWTVSEPRVNFALGRPATQSSTGYSGVAARAVDGNTDGLYNNNSVTWTNSTAQPWWQVNLQQPRPIDNVVLWNRTDCCGERLQNFYILVSNTDMTNRSLAQLLADPNVVSRQVGAATIAPSLSIAVGATGRYLRVQLTATQTLSLAEVQVFGTPAPNRPPVLTQPAAQTSTQGTPVTLALTASDPDGDALGFSATGLPTGLAISASTGAISGTPSAAGSFSTAVTVQDGRGGSANASFTWTVQPPPNRPPVLTQPPAQTTTQGTPVTLVLAASDPDGDTLGYAATGLPTGLSINAANGVISGTPTVVGSFNPAVTVQDGRGGSANASFSWRVQTPANEAPILTTPAAQTATRGTAASLAIAASDPNGDPLTFSATGLPTGLSINASSGLISGTPSVTGSFNPTLTVQDDRGGSVTGSFAWTVQEPPATNLALNKPATQSSTGFSGVASRAVDGRTDGIYNNGSVTWTNPTAQPWWQVNLGQLSAVDSVVLWNRTDCCGDRLQNFYVLLSNSDMTGRTLDQLLADPNVLARQVGAANIAPSLSVAVGGVGRYLRVQLAGTQTLSLAEVQVVGNVVPAGGEPATGTGLPGEYFATNNLSGSAVLLRTEAIDFNFGTASPGPGVPSDNFSVRWSGRIEAAATGSFQLRTNSDDGIRVWLDGQLVINNWTAHAPTLNTSANISLVADQRYNIVVEYQDFAGGAVAQLFWRLPGTTTFAIVPANRLYGP